MPARLPERQTLPRVEGNHMATTITRLTFDDLESIPAEQEGDRHELINGELIVTPVPIPRHQIISSNIDFALQRHVRENSLGRVLHAPTGVRFTPDNLLIPDIIFTAHDRLHVIGSKYVDAPPDLAVEILSPGTRRRDLTVKRDLYARFGVREYWIVDPEATTVTVLGLVGKGYDHIPTNEEGAVQSRVLPELSLPLEAIFEGIETPRQRDS
jgi:Uma2 family endonuclease